MRGIDGIISKIREKYLLRRDARDEHGNRNGRWVTMNGAHVFIDSNGDPTGPVGDRMITEEAPRDRLTRVRDELSGRIRNGTYSTRLNRRDQNKHFRNTERYRNEVARGNHPSYLTISPSEVQGLIERYVTEGSPRMLVNGAIRVRFEHDSVIGVAVSTDGSMRTPTRVGEIHISRRGAHIVPIYRL